MILIILLLYRNYSFSEVKLAFRTVHCGELISLFDFGRISGCACWVGCYLGSPRFYSSRYYYANYSA
jgi:hypothetical protein